MSDNPLFGKRKPTSSDPIGMTQAEKDELKLQADIEAFELQGGQVTKRGNIVTWSINGSYHRDNGPAWKDSTSEIWYQNGKRHREDGPAFSRVNGYQEWCLNDLRNREGDLPAVVKPDGTKQWYKDDLLHRESGPAIESVTGQFKEWRIKDLRHREDGPAVIDRGHERWFLEGVEYTTEGEWKRAVQEYPAKVAKRKIEIKAFEKQGGVVEWWTHAWEWRMNGELHREDGPAMIHHDGDEGWYFEGKEHRTDGPAWSTREGLEWYQHGKRHREDGPAVINNNGTKQWWLDDYQMTEKEWTKELKSRANR